MKEEMIMKSPSLKVNICLPVKGSESPYFTLFQPSPSLTSPHHKEKKEL